MIKPRRKSVDLSFFWDVETTFRHIFLLGGGHWDFRACGFDYFFDRFFGFCAKKSRFFGFGVHCSLRIFRILAFSFRFLQKIVTGFRI